MPQWDADFYGSWDDTRQELFDSFAQSMQEDIDLYQDQVMQAYVDILFGDDPIGGDRWSQTHNALVEYMFDTYDINFDDVWDWDAWREAYGASE